MTVRFFRAGLLVLVVLTVLVRCPSGYRAVLYSNKAILENLGTNVFSRGYTEILKKATGLKDRVEELNSPARDAGLTTAQLTELRSAWKSLNQSIRRLDWVQFGPAFDDLLFDQLDSWPRKVIPCYRPTMACTGSGSLEERISAGEVPTVSDFSTLGVVYKGNKIIGYLLYVAADNSRDAQSVATGLRQERWDYLLGAVTDLERGAAVLRDSWRKFLPTYAQDEPGPYDTPAEGISESVSQFLFALDLIRTRKLEMVLDFTAHPLPSGESISEENSRFNIGKLEFPFGRTSLADLRETLIGARALYQGEWPGKRPGPGLDEIVRVVAPAVDKRTEEALASVFNALDRVEDKYADLYTAFQQEEELLRDPNRESGSLLYQLEKRTRELEDLARSELVTATGANPGVSGNDGD